MFFLALTVNQDIVYINNAENVKVIKYGIINKTLEHCKAIYKAKLQDLWLVVTKRCTERQ
jgi:hypothetical protein